MNLLVLNITEKFCDKVALRFIRALSLSLQFSQFCSLYVSTLFQAGFFHGSEVAIFISQSNTLPYSHLGNKRASCTH